MENESYPWPGSLPDVNCAIQFCGSEFFLTALMLGVAAIGAVGSVAEIHESRNF